MSTRKRRKKKNAERPLTANNNPVCNSAPLLDMSGRGANGNHVVMSAKMSGPIPAPSILRQYGEIIPGLDTTIIEEWKAEGASRRKNEEKELEIREDAVKKHATREFLKVCIVGVFFAGIFMLAFYLAYLGHVVEAAAVASTPVIGSVITKLLPKN